MLNLGLKPIDELGYMFTFYQPEVQQGVHQLDAEESRHCIKVLRKQAGDKIRVIDGNGWVYEASIKDANPKHCTFDVLSQNQSPQDPFYIHIAIAPTKNIDRTEWFVEKAVEIGIHEISFILCQHSERKVLKLERVAKKAVSAMKQSGRLYLPRLNAPVSLKDLIKSKSDAEKFIAYIGDNSTQKLSGLVQSNDSYLVLIGPEGGFSSQEAQLAFSRNFASVKLGDSRLRTETAGLVACHTLQLLQLLKTN